MVEVGSAAANEVLNTNEAVTTANPIEAAISPYLENVFQITSLQKSSFEMRNRRMQEIAFGEPQRPAISNRKSRPPVEPLKVRGFRSQQLWGQL